jgi:hypothetical protein
VVSADSYWISRVQYYSGYRSAASPFVYVTITRFGSTFLNDSTRLISLKCGPTTPASKLTGLACSDFARHYFRNTLFSSPYLDVSVRAVPSTVPMYSEQSYRLTPAGFPHSDIPGYSVLSRLPEAYRSDTRPSSAYGAKASTVHP